MTEVLGRALAPDLLAVTWEVQGKSSAPDNLYDWLLADNRYPQYRGRAAALAFIQKQAREITRLQTERGVTG
jgi:hypothetical protein